MRNFTYRVIGIDHKGWKCPLAVTQRLVSSLGNRGAWDYYTDAKASGLYRKVTLVQEFSQIVAEEDLTPCSES